MTRIWLKTMRGEKLDKSRIFQFEGVYKTADFYKYLTEICEKSDIPVPMVLARHQKHFAQFNIVRFKKDDFVETVDFSTMLLEYVPEDKLIKL